MSTTYDLIKQGDHELTVTEHSGVFDIELHNENADVDLVTRLTVEQLSEVGLRLLQVALYNCADVNKLREWLHVRVNEVDYSATKTPFPEST
jgi:hypothetical protein